MKKYKFSAITMIGILVLLLIPTDGIPNPGIPHKDKILHFGLFGFLMFINILEKYLYNRKISSIFKTTVIFILFALVTEILQYLSGYRSFEIADLLADTLGIITSAFVFVKIFNTMDSYRKNKL